MLLDRKRKKDSALTLNEVHDMGVIIDWLQFTIIDNNIDYTKTIIDILRLDVNNFICLDKGKLGYRSQMYYNNISVLYEGTPTMGVHVILSGQGCRYYESEHPLIELIERINTHGGKLTRIDLAMDDTSGKVIKFDNLVKDITAANVITRWKDNTEIIKRSNSDSSKQGHTINVGSGASRIYMRIYNKALEQKQEGVWNRIELEIKKEYAEQIQQLLTTENVGQLMAKIMNNYIRIVEPNENDKNKSRWKTKPYWERIIKTTEKQKLTRLSVEKTVDTTKDWIRKQIAPSLALVTINDDGNLDFLVQQVIQGQTRLKERHIKMLKRGRKL